MKVALVCIAKNEDHYIREWVDYHKLLHFDNVFIYNNDWECTINDPVVVKTPITGVAKQYAAYNHFIQTNHDKYDWAAFFDVDEFLVLKKHNTIQEFIYDYIEYPAIGINWVLFGNNGLNEITNDEYSVLKRFTKRQRDVNPHIKSIIKLDPNVYMGIHNPNNINWVNTNQQIGNGPFNDPGIDNVAQLNHYFCKTKIEYAHKCSRLRADNGTERTFADYDRHNLNEVDDLSAYNLYVKNK